MTKSMRLFLLALPLAVCPAQAQDSARPLVRVEINPETVTVGQAATLRVTVLVPTWFTKPPVFPSFELPNTVTRLPPDSSFSTNERFGRETWSGIVRDYLVYPQVSARFELTGGIVRVTYADPETRRPVTEDVAVPPVTYAGTIPAGAASLDPFLPAAALTLEQSLEGGSGQLTAGDAMIRTVTARVEGLPSLFLPRLVHDPNAEGITAYPKEPVTEDVQAGRGRGFDGRRTETVTYVFERGGRHRLPEVTLRWWNTKTNSVETAALPAVDLAVAPAPGERAAGDSQAAERPDRVYWIAGVLLLAGLALGLRFGPALRALVRVKAADRRDSEGYAFRVLDRACNRADPETIEKKLIAWLDRIEPGMTVERLASRARSRELANAVTPLERVLYSRETDGVLTSADRKTLRSALHNVRREYGTRQTIEASHVKLPPLNPTRGRSDIPTM